MYKQLSVLGLVASICLVIGGCGGSGSTAKPSGSTSGSTSTGTVSTAAAAADPAAGSSTSASTTKAPGKPLTVSQLDSKAHAICTRLNATLEGAKDIIRNQQDMVSVASQRGALEQAALNELSELTPPTAVAKDWQQMLVDRHMLVEDLAQLRVDAASGNTGAEHTVIVSSTGTLAAVLKAAEHGGFKGCGKVG